MATADPSLHATRADPPGRRSIAASLPNQAASPSAVVSAAQTLSGGWATSTVRSTRSGKPITPPVSSNPTVATVSQPIGCVNALPERSLGLVPTYGLTVDG